MRTKTLFALLILMLCLAACAPMTPPAAGSQTAAPTLPATRYPTPSRTPAAATPTAQVATPAIVVVTPTHTASPTALPTNRRGAMIGIFCLSIKQGIEGSSVSLQEPVGAEVGRVLAGAGLVFVPDRTDCDAVLSLDLTFIPRSYQYPTGVENQTETCYTGAALRGTADLTWQDDSLYHRELRAEFVPNGEKTGCPIALGAPFSAVWRAAVMSALTEIWGKNVMVPALMDPNPVLRAAASESLALLNQKEILLFLPFLSTTLTDPNDTVRLNVLKTLQRSVLLDPQAFIDVTPQLLDLLIVEQQPEILQRTVDLLVGIAQSGRMQPEIKAAFHQALSVSEPPTESTSRVLILLDGIAELGPVMLDTSPQIIAYLAAAGDLVYAQQVLEALKSVSGQDFGSDVEQWLAWWASVAPPG